MQEKTIAPVIPMERRMIDQGCMPDMSMIRKPPSVFFWSPMIVSLSPAEA